MGLNALLRSLIVVLIAPLVLVSGCSGDGRIEAPAPPKPVPALEIDLSHDDQAELLAAAIADGWFHLALQSRAPAGDLFYVVEPRVSGAVLDALRRSAALPPAEIIWVENLEAVPHNAADGVFTDGYAVSVGNAVILSPGSVKAEVSYHYGVGNAYAWVSRIERSGGGWSVALPRESFDGR